MKRLYNFYFEDSDDFIQVKARNLYLAMRLFSQAYPLLVSKVSDVCKNFESKEKIENE